MSETIKLSDIEEAASKLNWQPAVESLGGGIYRLPGGALTNRAGVEQFEREIRELISKEDGKLVSK